MKTFEALVCKLLTTTVHLPSVLWSVFCLLYLFIQFCFVYNNTCKLLA